MDWNLRGCSRRGHATYAPTEPRYLASLCTDTPHGQAWRCLRCGNFVLGEPNGAGPAEDAPILLRGKALRSAYILRLLAIERWIRGLVIVAAGVAVLLFRSSQGTVRERINSDLSAAKPLLDQLGFSESGSGLVREIEKALNARGTTLILVASGLLLYGGLQVVEGVGLWMLKRWGEYFAVVATSLFLPLEIYELVEKLTVLRVIVFVINIAAVFYLLLSKRLFGLRGGHAAYRASMQEASLLEVETSSSTST